MIEYDSVTKVFKTGKTSVVALDNISFSIDQGNVVVLLGPSGCGKTTLLRLTNKLDSLTTGTIRISGKEIRGIDGTKLRQGIGYVIQETGLFPHKTIEDNIAVVPRLLGWDKDKIRSRTEVLLRMVRLDPESYRHRFPAELSGGQQQRVGVARALAADPEILLMDEPFGAIDPINREKLQNEFLKLQAELKKTVIFVSHDIHEAIKMGDKIALFDKGKLIQYDTPETILIKPENKFVANFVGADRALKVLGIIRVNDIMNRSAGNLVQYPAPVSDALKFMDEKNLNYGIVVNGTTPVGYVTPEHLRHKNKIVKDALEPLPVVIKTNDSLRDALSYMLMHNHTTLAIVDDNENFAGTITLNSIQTALRKHYPEHDQ